MSGANYRGLRQFFRIEKVQPKATSQPAAGSHGPTPTVPNGDGKKGQSPKQPPAQKTPVPPTHGSAIGTHPGRNCLAQGGDSVCLGLKFIQFEDKGGDQRESLAGSGLNADALRSSWTDGAQKTMDRVNRIWSQCGIEFQVEDFKRMDPAEIQLEARSRNQGELDDIRRALADENAFLVVVTGEWDRSGSLGETWANAWTNMPGEGLYGAVLEESVGRNANMIAHEMGHYLGLGHEESDESLMHPLVYPGSRQLSSTECDSAREAVAKYWSKMVRAPKAEIGD